MEIQNTVAHEKCQQVKFRFGQKMQSRHAVTKN